MARHPSRRFEAEFARLEEDVQDELLAVAGILRVMGPQLGRPRVDTRKGSKFPNMKELRFSAADGEWRAPSRSIRRDRP